jgi:hypothetical protein
MGVHKSQIMASETWVSFFNTETKEHSKQWTAHSPNKSKKFKQMLSSSKLMATVLWHKKGVLMVEFMQQGTTLTSEVYCETLKKCVVPFRTNVWNAHIQCSAPP